jgi:hypothetical protein
MQTAVEWYSNKLLEILGESVNNFTNEQTMVNHYALKQANKMFEQQIIDARLTAPPIKPNEKYSFKKEAEQYYKETFKK